MQSRSYNAKAGDKFARRICRVLILIFSVSLGLSFRSPIVQAAGIISFSASKEVVEGGEIFEVFVEIDHTPNLAALQMSISYDASKLLVRNVEAGSAWPTGNTDLYQFSWPGTIGFAASIRGSASLDTPGHLLHLTFEAIKLDAPATTSLQISNVLPFTLMQNDANPIQPTLPASFSLTTNPGQRISGIVMLQKPAPGRWVSASLLRGSYAVFGTAMETTKPQLNFSFTVPSGDSYTLTTLGLCHAKCVKPYLSAPSQQNITLLAGDVNADTVIDIRDIVLLKRQIATRSTGSFPCADVNGDGQVNNADLEVVSSNFGRACE